MHVAQSSIPLTFELRDVVLRASSGGLESFTDLTILSALTVVRLDGGGRGGIGALEAPMELFGLVRMENRNSPSYFPWTWACKPVEVPEGLTRGQFNLNISSGACESVFGVAS